MVLIDQVVGEIIVNNACALCESEKNWINRLQSYKELNYYNNYILNRGCPHSSFIYTSRGFTNVS